jgi:DegV family protein with EDD domain
MGTKVGLVCDSTADFPAGMDRVLGLHILPVHIVMSGRDYLHGVGISNAEILKGLKRKKDIYTKPFYPAECADLYERMLKRYDHLVSFHLSTHMSKCYKSAVAALNLLRPEDARRVTILDTECVSISMGLMVKRAVMHMRRGTHPRRLEQKLADDRRRLFMNFTVESLFWLKKGGRVSALAAFVGKILNVKPVIVLDKARLVPFEKHRGKKQALKRITLLADEFRQMSGGDFELWLAYAANLDEVIHMREKLAVLFNCGADHIKLVEIGATILVHGGPGCVALAMAPG